MNLLEAIEKAMAAKAGTVTMVDIIHQDWCESTFPGTDPLDCDCEPEYRQRRVN
jgi:hypothetical protein